MERAFIYDLVKQFLSWLHCLPAGSVYCMSCFHSGSSLNYNPLGDYLFKVNNKYTIFIVLNLFNVTAKLTPTIIYLFLLPLFLTSNQFILSSKSLYLSCQVKVIANFEEMISCWDVDEVHESTTLNLRPRLATCDDWIFMAGQRHVIILESPWIESLENIPFFAVKLN